MYVCFWISLVCSRAHRSHANDAHGAGGRTRELEQRKPSAPADGWQWWQRQRRQWWRQWWRQWRHRVECGRSREQAVTVQGGLSLLVESSERVLLLITGAEKGCVFLCVTLDLCKRC
jgi:hypothetical protein